jgi:hypothetical protein
MLHKPRSAGRVLAVGSVIVLAVVGVLVVMWRFSDPRSAQSSPSDRAFQPRKVMDISGFLLLIQHVPAWPGSASLEEIGELWRGAGFHMVESLDRASLPPGMSPVDPIMGKVMALHFEGEAERAYKLLEEARAVIANSEWSEEWLYTIIYYQGVTALRRGENDNCVECRGESSCIIPLAPSAIHTRALGSRLAIKHFTEYLEQFPDDLGVRWLLNLAYMTLGEHPGGVPAKQLLSLDRFFHSEFDIGKFRDIGHLVGVNRFNQAGGGIMEDFDNDGLLDIVVTSMDPTLHMAYYRNKGDGTFEDRTKAAGLEKQLGGLYCVQTDYNNDGFMDIFICRGAWLAHPIRPTLLRNNGNGTFTDVTREAGLLDPVNSISACWADYDNDGFLDLFICCERQPNRLYRNKGDGTFEEVALRAGVQGKGQTCKGATWIDFDNDGWPDLFVNYLGGSAQLFRNNRDGTFTDVTREMGIAGPEKGFSCWAFDFDNDGWLDIFATSYDHSLDDLVKGLIGQPHGLQTSRLYRNRQGKGFEDVTKQAGLDMVFATMGSNFADFDNDGYLDIYLGTGDPSLETIVPNRMFKNVAGRRFAEITGTSGTGHLQKGHSVACGDWDRDGNVDLFIQMGGAINGDRYHNVLFQNPGHRNNWLTVKLIGKKTNRAAIGARIKIVTAAKKPLTVHRHVSSGSSFGANPLQQTIGLGRADRVAVLEITWPTSGTTQVFRDIPANQAIEVTEFDKNYRPLNWKPIPVPK